MIRLDAISSIRTFLLNQCNLDLGDILLFLILGRRAGRLHCVELVNLGRRLSLALVQEFSELDHLIFL